MLAKIQGVTRVDKLRTILLMEEDFNFGNKLHISKSMIDAANGNQVIPLDMFASKKNSCVIEVALYRSLFFDIVLQRIQYCFGIL